MNLELGQALEQPHGVSTSSHNGLRAFNDDLSTLMRTPDSRDRRFQVPLRIALTFPFILLITIAVSLTGYLSFENGQQSVNYLVWRLQGEMAGRVQQTVEAYLAVPHLINRLNIDAVQQGELNLADPAQMTRHLTTQMRQFPSVSEILFGHTTGEVAVVERGADLNPPLKPQRSSTLPIASADGPIALVGTVPNRHGSNPFWYESAVEQHRPSWSDIAPDAARSELAIYASQPLYSPDTQTVIGVFSVKLGLTALNQFLHLMMQERLGEVFILERSGLLVASSDAVPPSSSDPAASLPPRLKPSDSPNPMIRATGGYLAQSPLDLTQVQQNYQFEFLHDAPTPSGTRRLRHFAQIMPFQDPYGLDWLIVTVIPESIVVEQLEQNTVDTIRLCLLALVSTTVLGTVTANWIARPILRLNRAALAIAHDQFDQTLPETVPIKELATMAHSFNRMADQLKDSLNRINLALRTSEEKFTKVFHVSPDPMRLTTLAEGRFLDVNDSFLHYSGYSREEVIGHTSTELGVWTNLDDQKRFRQLLREGPVRGLELDYRTKAGEIRTWLFSAEIIEIDGVSCILGISRDITDRKRVEQQLRDSEAKLRQAQRVAHVGSWEIDLTTQTVSWSEEQARMMGYLPSHPAPLYQQVLQQCLHPDEQVAVEQLVRRAIATQTPFEVEHRIIRADRSVRDVISRGEVTVDDQSNVIRLFGTTLDITERKQIETLQKQHLAELVEWRNRHEAAVLASGQVLYEWNTRSDRLTWGSKAEQMFGCPIDQLPATVDSYLVLVHPDDYCRIQQQRTEAIATKGSFRAEYRIQRADGHFIWIEDKSQFFSTRAGHSMMLIGFLADITERKQAEAALKESREQLNSILNSLDSVVWSVSCADYQLLYISPATQEIYGRDCHEFVDYPRLWTETIYADDRDYVQQGSHTLYQQGVKDQEYRIVHADGSLRWVRTRARLICDSEGCAVRIDGMTSDISDRKLAEEALRNSLHEKEILLSEIHHRVKNNLQVISSLLDLQAMRTPDGDARQALEDSCSRVYSMALVHEHLYRSQNFAQVNFADYTVELAHYLRTTYQQSGLDIRLDINIDPTVSIRLDQAIPCGLLTNELITNSIKYGFKSNQPGYLYIRLKPLSANHLCLSIGNDGDTLPPNFQLNGTFNSMGLQLVLTLVEQLEGCITFDRVPDTLFHITFPT